MNTVLYSGRLWRHKHTLLGGDQWKECWLVLRADGQLVIFNDKHCTKVVSRSSNVITDKAGLRIGSEALTLHRAHRPIAPFGEATVDALFMTLPSKAKKKSAPKPLWFYFKTERDLIGWLRAFATVIGKERVFDAILEGIREEEERVLREELAAMETPAVIESYEESSKHSGLSIRGETYRQKRNERNFDSIWASVLNEPPMGSTPSRSHSALLMYEEELPQHDRTVSASSSSTSNETQTPDNGYHTHTSREHSQDTVAATQITAVADVHSQRSSISDESHSVTMPASPEEQFSSGRASDNDDDSTRERASSTDTITT